jgi:KUP system potassium uptake protein
MDVRYGRTPNDAPKFASVVFSPESSIESDRSVNEPKGEHPSESHGGHGRQGLGALAFATLGIVYGDIGTSPIYALRETFEHSDLTVEKANAYGVASVVFWALVIVISVKYLALVMRADNHGEGGILALTALVIPPKGQTPTRIGAAVITLGVFGTALLYGDGLITPAISVLSAVEGFEIATSAFSRFVIPVSVIILIGLFSVQRRGTAGIAKVFSPVMVLWFFVLGALGLRQILKQPEVLRAVSPTYAVEFFLNEPWHAFIALGSIFLVVTGGEALYADMGHFGRRAIQISWYALVLPGLLLNYFGQAAMLSDGREEVGSPFYDMAPEWGITPLAILSTLATVIASQALISGAFSLTAQAVQLGYLPRLAIHHTSSTHIGQVYVPLVNWLLMIGCVGLVVAFRSSSALAAAYGIAVTATMLLTTLIFFRVVRDRWHWSAGKAVIALVPFLIVDVAFLAANIPKIPSGGWFPLVVGFVLVIQMTTWRRGRELVASLMQREGDHMGSLIRDLEGSNLHRVSGTAVYLCKDVESPPPALLSNLRHHKVLHEMTMLVAVDTTDTPHVPLGERGQVSRIAPGLVQVRLHFGFTDEPDVPTTLAAVAISDHEFKPDDVTYFLGRESVSASKLPGMHPLREELFVLLNRGAANAARFFMLPSAQVVEIGSQVEI